MIDLALFLKRNGYRPDQVQDFIPAPFDIATCMYYTGIDPFTGEQVYTAKALRDRKLQRALLQFFKPENYFEVREALMKAGRQDLIGSGCDALIPANPPRVALQARMRASELASDRRAIRPSDRSSRSLPGGRIPSGSEDRAAASAMSRSHLRAHGPIARRRAEDRRSCARGRSPIPRSRVIRRGGREDPRDDLAGSPRAALFVSSAKRMAERPLIPRLKRVCGRSCAGSSEDARRRAGVPPGNEPGEELDGVVDHLLVAAADDRQSVRSRTPHEVESDVPGDRMADQVPIAVLPLHREVAIAIVDVARPGSGAPLSTRGRRTRRSCRRGCVGARRGGLPAPGSTPRGADRA